MGAVMKNMLNPVPIDPITTMVSEKMPKSVQAVMNPAGPALKSLLGDQGARFALDPLGVGKNNVNSAKQSTALLAEGSGESYDDATGTKLY